MVPVAFLVTVIVFLLVRLSPGDPVLIYAGEERDPVQLEQIRRSLGLDQPRPEPPLAAPARARCRPAPAVAFRGLAGAGRPGRPRALDRAAPAGPRGGR